MKVFRTVGKGLGNAGGTLIGGSVKFLGRKVNNKWTMEVGDQIKDASVFALDNTGQFIDGVLQSTYGLVKRNDYHKYEGLQQLKDTSGRTFKGFGGVFIFTAKNAGTTFSGIANRDKEQVIVGMKNLGKVVAISTLAIGVVDIADGADLVSAEEIETRNDHLNGFEHAETGVPFVEKTVTLPSGEVVEGTFPVFDSKFNVVIAEDLYLTSDDMHFSVANDILYQAVVEDPSLGETIGLSSSDVGALALGETPEGYTWHHSEEPGVLQLVETETHANTGHTGGRELWGGGSEYR